MSTISRIPRTAEVYTKQQTNAALSGKASKSDVEPLLFSQYYPDGSVKSAAEFTAGIKYDAPNTVNRTITVKPFCNTDRTAENDNSNLSGRVVIPPFVDASGNPHISDDGTRYKVVGVKYGLEYDPNTNLTSVVAPNTVTTIEEYAFYNCIALTTASLPAATTIDSYAFGFCTHLTSVSLPAATTIDSHAFGDCTSLVSVSLPAATTINSHAFEDCTSLVSVSLPAATTIDSYAFGFCTHLTSVSLPAATGIGNSTFYSCTSLVSVSLPAATTIDSYAFASCTSLTSVSLPSATAVNVRTFAGCTLLDSVDFGDTMRSSIPALGTGAFNGVPDNCTIIVPYTQYDAWIAADGWKNLPQEFVRHSEKADKPATFTTGNLAALDAQGNPTDSQIPKASVVTIPAYNGRNRGYVTSEGGGELSSWLSVSGSTESTMAHGPWTMPRSGIVYVQLQQMSNTDTSVRIGVNGKPVKIESGSVVVDYDYQVVECRVAAKSDVVFPLFMNSGDELYMGVYNTALSKISLSAIYYPAPPADSSQLLQAMSDKGIDVSGITDYGGIADALGLGDADTPQDAVDAVANT